MIPLTCVPRVVSHRDTVEWWLPGTAGSGEMGRGFFLGVEFPFREGERDLEIGYQQYEPTYHYWMLKNGYDGKFYVYFATIKINFIVL